MTKPSRPLSIVGLALAIASASPVFGADIDGSSADQALRQMSTKLAAARAFSFHAQRKIPATEFGNKDLPQSARIEVTVLRPDRITVKSVGKDDVRHFFADGQKLTVFDATRKFYTTVPMKTSLDGLLDRIGAEYGFIPPLAEFALTDVYADIRHKSQTIGMLGRKYLPAGFLGLGGTECDRIALTGKVANAELWVGVEDQLPHKLIVTFKNRAGQPQIVTTFTDWNLTAKPNPDDFRFVPPKDAMKVPMVTSAEMKAAWKAEPSHKK